MKWLASGEVLDTGDRGGLDELDEMLAASGDWPLLLFKHSRSCGMSAEALDELIAHVDERPADATYAMVTVQTHPRRLERGHEQAWRAARHTASAACPRGTGGLERVALSCYGRRRGRSDSQFPADGVGAADSPGARSRADEGPALGEPDSPEDDATSDDLRQVVTWQPGRSRRSGAPDVLKRADRDTDDEVIR